MVVTVFSLILTCNHVVLLVTGVHRGDWYFPDGSRLKFNDDIFEARGAQRVDLRRRNSATSPVGIYHCNIATVAVHDDSDISIRATVYVGLYAASGGMYGSPFHTHLVVIE